MRQWNQNYPIGGTGCLIRTLEGNTGRVHRPLRRRRLPRVQADGRRARRGAGLHPRARSTTQHPPAAHRRAAHPRRARRRCSTCGCASRSATGRTSAHRAPAGVPLLGDPGGDLDPAAPRSRPSSTRSSTRPRSRSRPTRSSGRHHARPGGQRHGASAWTRSSSSRCRTSPTRPTRTGCSGRRPPSRSGRPCATTGRSAPRPRSPAPARRRRARRSPSPPPTSPSTCATPRGCRGWPARPPGALEVQGFAGVTTTAPRPRPPSRSLVEYSGQHARTPAPSRRPSPGAVVEKTERPRCDACGSPSARGAPDVAEVPNRLGTDPLPSPSISPSPTPTESIPTRKADTDICS